jgi:hypothetical protein
MQPHRTSYPKSKFLSSKVVNRSGSKSRIYLSSGWGIGELTAVKDVLYAAVNAQDKDIRKLADDFAALPGWSYIFVEPDKLYERENLVGILKTVRDQSGQKNIEFTPSKQEANKIVILAPPNTNFLKEAAGNMMGHVIQLIKPASKPKSEPVKKTELIAPPDKPLAAKELAAQVGKTLEKNKVEPKSEKTKVGAKPVTKKVAASEKPEAEKPDPAPAPQKVEPKSAAKKTAPTMERKKSKGANKYSVAVPDLVRGVGSNSLSLNINSAQPSGVYVVQTLPDHVKMDRVREGMGLATESNGLSFSITDQTLTIAAKDKEALCSGLLDLTSFGVETRNRARLMNHDNHQSPNLPHDTIHNSHILAPSARHKASQSQRKN